MNLREQYKKQVEQEVKGFRKGVDKINSSDHPKYNVEGAREYEINGLREQLDAKVAELDAEFKAKIDEQIEHAAKQASRATVPVSPSDKARLSEITADLYADFIFARDVNKKGEAFDKFMEKVSAFEDSGVGPLFELKRLLPDLMKKVEGDSFAEQKLRSIYSELASLKTDEEERLDALKADKHSGVTHSYRVLKMTNRAYSSHQKARRI